MCYIEQQRPMMKPMFLFKTERSELIDFLNE